MRAPKSKQKPKRVVEKHDAASVVAWLRRTATKRTRDGMARYGLPSDKAFGVPVGVMQTYAKRLGKNHALAGELWGTGWYEARMLAAFIDDPARVTSGQMDQWCRDFDNWGICDTACFHLFDRTPHAWRKVAQWSVRRDEFVKRAAFALLASLAVRDKESPDARFARCLPLVERAAADDRNFVKKGVSWALRTIGRRSRGLNKDAVALARRLAVSPHPSAQWLGREALRELTGPVVRRKLARDSGR